MADSWSTTSESPNQRAISFSAFSTESDPWQMFRPTCQKKDRKRKRNGKPQNNEKAKIKVVLIKLVRSPVAKPRQRKKAECLPAIIHLGGYRYISWDGRCWFCGGLKPSTKISDCQASSPICKKKTSSARKVRSRQNPVYHGASVKGREEPIALVGNGEILPAA